MPVETYETVGFVGKKAQKILHQCEKFDAKTALSELETKTLLEILDSAAHISGGIRSAVKYPDPAYTRFRENMELREILGRSDIQIGYTQQGYLRLVTPPLLQLSNRRSVQIAFAMEDALIAFRAAGNAIPTHPSFFIVYKRFATNMDSENLCDNDNMEARKITNVLVRMMGLSDNPGFASFIYTTLSAAESLTEITVFPRGELMKVCAYIDSPAPEGIAKTSP